LKSDEAWRVVEIIKAVLKRTGPVAVPAKGIAKATKSGAKAITAAKSATAAQPGVTAKSAVAEKSATSEKSTLELSVKTWAATLIAENYQAEDFRRLLGVNHFNDVTWFNKEAFEEALLYIPLFSLFETGEEKSETIAVITEQFRKAEAASGYKLDALIEALTEKQKKAPAKKNKPRTNTNS